MIPTLLKRQAGTTSVRLCMCWIVFDGLLSAYGSYLCLLTTLEPPHESFTTHIMRSLLTLFLLSRTSKNITHETHTQPL
jgi:hypothetical protein